MNLYEINTGILECIDTETGEILDEEKLHELAMAREEKLENIACWVKNLRANVTAYKDEKKSFEERIARDERLIASLERTLVNELQGQKFTTQRVAVSFRKSEKVEIADEAKLPEKYLTYAEPKPNKVEIKRVLKEGGMIDGCSLTEHQNIHIK